MQIAQALFGYSNGHHLLAASTSLSSQTLKILEPLTDVSGPEIPRHFDGYLTGYPLIEDKCYALSKTWAAPEMSRPGCVWTHTLFLKSDHLLKDDLKYLDIENLFHRPVHAMFEEYFQPIHVQDAVIDPNATNTRGNQEGDMVAEMLFNLLLNYSDPIVLMANQIDMYNKAFEILLTQFGYPFFKDISFCTGSLANRLVNHKILDLQIAPRDCSKSLFRSESKMMFFDSEKVNCASPFTQIYRESKNLKKQINVFAQDVCMDSFNRSNFKGLYGLYQIVVREKTFDWDRFISYWNQCNFGNYKEYASNQLFVKLFDSDYSADDFNRRNKEFCLTVTKNSVDDANSEFLNLISQKSVDTIVKEFLNYNRNETVDLFQNLLNSDINCVGEKAMIAFALNITQDDYSKLVTVNNSSGSIFVKLNWRLAICKALWEQSENIQIETILFLATPFASKMDEDQKTFGDILTTVFNVSKYNLAHYICSAFGIFAVKLFWKWAEGEEEFLKIQQWISIGVSDTEVALNAIKFTKNPNLFLASIKNIDPYDTTVLHEEPSTWLNLYYRFCENYNSATIRSYYARFILPIILQAQINYSEDFAYFAFKEVHSVLERDDMNYIEWAKISRFLPEVSIYSSWDKCKRLRKAARKRGYDFKLN